MWLIFFPDNIGRLFQFGIKRSETGAVIARFRYSAFNGKHITEVLSGEMSGIVDEIERCDDIQLIVGFAQTVAIKRLNGRTFVRYDGQTD